MFEKHVSVLGVAFLLGGCLTVHLPKAEIERQSEPKAVTWVALVRQALANNPDLREARARVESKARSRDIAFGDYLPAVDGGVHKSASRTTSGPTSDRLSLDISARQSFFDGLGTTGKWLGARKDLEAERFAYNEMSADICHRLRTSYINVIRLEKLFETNRLISERRKQNAEMVRLRYEAGRENLGSALRAEAIAEQAAFDVRQTERQLEKEALRLARESGGEFVLPLRVDDDLEKMTKFVKLPEEDYAGLADETPAVLRLLKVAESAKAEMMSAQSSVWPQVDGTYEYGYSGDRASHLKDQSSIGVSVTMPFFEGGKNVAAIRKAKADYDAAENAVRSARDETVAQLAAARAPFIDAVEVVQVRKKFLEAARERAEIIRTEYATGLVNFLDFDTAEQENANAEKEYVESLANVFIQQSQWAKIRGVTLEEAYDEIQNQ
ncbi:MAG: Outer membrane efflux protein BepC precursor [Candidatus Omnitrophica bacterium ADurb.Bin292]|nr:MAG: Outer membrane efflux protein BepC precursor [Candidatus Omnitrophica bacterium ADurb.Bin292]HPW76567.1 TolC family protein [Candidatus Omnitrophota bacterium]HQB12129.1 TolC family protein [Candidatus Omnitrophota bacterium]